MATAAELLADVLDVDRTLVVDNSFRTISIPSSVPNLGVEHDDDVLRLDFKMPRYIGNTDLSSFSIRINYINANGESDVYTVNEPTIDTQYITFSWLVGPTATRYKGDTQFNICAKTLKANGEDDNGNTVYIIDKEFNTTPASLPVLAGLEVDESIVTKYSDIIEQWRRELFGIGDTEESSIKAVSADEQASIKAVSADEQASIKAVSADEQAAIKAVSADEQAAIKNKGIEVLATIKSEDGATFIPNVSENGDLSWSNDKGLENPATINIMGNGKKTEAGGEIFGDYENNQATANLSTAFGSHTTASGLNSVAGGHYSSAQGDYSASFGYESTAAGNHAFAAGSNNSALGIASVVMGSQNEVSDNSDAAAVFGCGNKALGQSDYTFIAGNFNETDPNASHGTHCSAAFGKSNIITDNAQFICGQYSDTTAGMAFVVGNGIDPSDGKDPSAIRRENAFVVNKDNSVKIAGTLSFKDLDVSSLQYTINEIKKDAGGELVTKEYVDSKLEAIQNTLDEILRVQREFLGISNVE